MRSRDQAIKCSQKHRGDAGGNESAVPDTGPWLRLGNLWLESEHFGAATGNANQQSPYLSLFQKFSAISGKDFYIDIDA